MTTLYELADEIRNAIASDDGEIGPEQLERLTALELAWDAKIDGICGLIRSWDHQAEALKSESDRLRERQARLQKNGERLKEWLRFCMATAGIRKHETTKWTAWRQANPPAVVVNVQPEKLPPEFQRVRIEADKAAILADWKRTKITLPGIEIKTDGESLRIR